MRKLNSRADWRPSPPSRGPAPSKRPTTSARPATNADFNAASTAARSSAGRPPSAMAARRPARARRSMMARWSRMLSKDSCGSSAPTRHGGDAGGIRINQSAAGMPGYVGPDSPPPGVQVTYRHRPHSPRRRGSSRADERPNGPRRRDTCRTIAQTRAFLGEKPGFPAARRPRIGNNPWNRP